MNIEELCKFCLSLSNVTQEMPFDKDTLVFKVGGKIFLLTNLSGPLYINLKCEPEYAILLRESYFCIRPGFHMNKKHWNTVEINGTLSDVFLCELIIQSYQLVISGMTKKDRMKLFC